MLEKNTQNSWRHLGVDTVVELSHRNAENLQEKMQQVNDQKKLVRRPPTLNEVEKWIAQAKNLPRAVEYSSSSTTTSEPDDKSDSGENLQDLEDRIEALQTKLSQLSAKLKTRQSEIQSTESLSKQSTTDTVETTKPKATLPKGFEAKPESTPQQSKPSRGTHYQKASKSFLFLLIFSNHIFKKCFILEIKTGNNIH